MFYGLPVLLCGARGRAIGWHKKFELPHFGIVRSADDTTVGRETAQHQGGRIQVTQQDLQRRLVKGGMHRFQDKVVVLVGLDLFDERFAHRLWSGAVLQELTGIRPPLTEVVIYVNARHTGRMGALLEVSESGCDRYSLTEYFVAIRKLEVVNDVDENQYSRRTVRGLSGWHVLNAEEWCGVKAQERRSWSASIVRGHLSS